MLLSTYFAVASLISASTALPFARACEGGLCKRTPSLDGANALQASTNFLLCQLASEASAVGQLLGVTSDFSKTVCIDPSSSASTTSTSVVASKPVAAAQLQAVNPAVLNVATPVVPVASATIAALPSTAVLAEQAFHATSTTSYFIPTTTPLPAAYSARASATTSAASASSTSHCTSSDPKVCADQGLALAAHNVARAAHHVEPLVWSDTLAAAASKWANNCQWAHSQGSLFPASYVYGENLFASTLVEPDISMSSVVAAFMDEEPNYDYNNPSFSPNAGQFTQVVWAATREVGCAIVTCNLGIFGEETTTSTLSVCNYFPSGNYINEFADNVHAI